jgi:PAT family beta-lactamase induction signal transducer AmpG
VVLPFREFFARSGWRDALWVLAFILLFKMGDSLAVALSTKFYIDKGFTLTQIGAVGKLVGFWASIVGGIVGGIWMVKLGINRGLWVFGAMQALGVLAFALLAKTGADPYMLAFAVGTDYFVDAGLGTTAFVAFLSRSSDQRYTATQYALFSSLAAVPRTFLKPAGSTSLSSASHWRFPACCCCRKSLRGMKRASRPISPRSQ